MKKIMVEVPVFIYSVENHTEVKSELLQLIEETPSGPYKTNAEDIGNSDWITAPEIERPYYSKMIETLMPYMLKFKDEMQADRITWDNFWFQQYESNEWHGWHIHPKSMYGMVYYLELPKESPPTNLMVNKEVLVPEAKEGDILFFPSILFHTSPKNTGSGRKTALVMNINLEEYSP
jgi:hypothetical protein